MRKNLPPTRHSKSSFTCSTKSANYRIIFKTRNGLFTEPNHKSPPSAKYKNSAPQSSTMERKGIKEYVKQMKNKSLQRAIDSQRHRNQPDIGRSPSRSLLPIEMQCPKLEQLTLDELEERVDELIEMKLTKTKAGLPNKIMEIQEINQQINTIIQYIHSPKFQCVYVDGEEDIDMAKRKIDILEKLMAQTNIQSEIFKNYFYGRKISKKVKNPTNFKYRVNFQQQKKMFEDLIRKTSLSSIHFQTTSRSSFKAPKPNDYPVKTTRQKYQFKNQPMPRSSYNRDYLVYGSLPRFAYKQKQSNFFPNCSSRSQCTSYKTEFTSKKIQKLDFKQLDCYKDKFKNLQISFMNEAKPRLLQYEEVNGKEKVIQVSNVQESFVVRKQIRHNTQPCHYVQTLNTQTKNNFKGENSKIRSQIKHKHLSDLKYAYKAYAHV